jgi:DNA-binding MarR family transcriptional regulator
MITSGTMTHRLQSLEARGLVRRELSPEDSRSMLVKLTASGLKLIDRAVEAHVENEHRILSPMSPSDLKALDAHLAKLLAILEPDHTAVRKNARAADHHGIR